MMMLLFLLLGLLMKTETKRRERTDLVGLFLQVLCSGEFALVSAGHGCSNGEKDVAMAMADCEGECDKGDGEIKCGGGSGCW